MLLGKRNRLTSVSTTLKLQSQKDKSTLKFHLKLYIHIPKQKDRRTVNEFNLYYNQQRVSSVFFAVQSRKVLNLELIRNQVDSFNLKPHRLSAISVQHLQAKFSQYNKSVCSSKTPSS